MGKTKYYYNPETCQYERVKVTFWNVLRYGVGVIAVGSVVFAGLVFIADQLIVTDDEKSLHAENQAMEKYQIVLTSNLNAIEQTISELHDRDNAIYERLFEFKNDRSLEERKRYQGSNILNAREDEFSTLIDQLSTVTHTLNKRSARVNSAFGNQFTITNEDVPSLQSIPTLQPVGKTDIDLVVSGFGTRINPFHKGKYMHTGIDFAANRGTDVFASAKGTVITANNSNLQAGYGNYIEIDHGNGFVTRYAHLENILIRKGQRIDKGTVIGTVGSSGGSIAPHLHYEVIYRGDNVDPLHFMVEGLSSQQYNRLVQLCNKPNQSLD